MKDVHDITFKSLMENKTFFVAFFKQYLPAEVFTNINWNTATIFKISGEHIREVFPFDNQAKVRITKDLADIAYIVDMQQGDKTEKAFLSLHVEHQSTPDKLLPLRMAFYIMGMLYEYAKVNHTDKLPHVYSLIFITASKVPTLTKKIFRPCLSRTMTLIHIY